jgi:hypothetical protein
MKNSSLRVCWSLVDLPTSVSWPSGFSIPFPLVPVFAGSNLVIIASLGKRDNRKRRCGVRKTPTSNAKYFAKEKE